MVLQIMYCQYSVHCHVLYCLQILWYDIFVISPTLTYSCAYTVCELDKQPWQCILLKFYGNEVNLSMLSLDRFTSWNFPLNNIYIFSTICMDNNLELNWIFLLADCLSVVYKRNFVHRVSLYDYATGLQYIRPLRLCPKYCLVILLHGRGGGGDTVCYISFIWFLNVFCKAVTFG